LNKTGSNDAVTDDATISNVVSTAANVTGKNSGNYEITYTADGVNAKIIPYIEIKAETSVSVAYGETVSLGASNSVDAAMTYEISGLFASQVFDVSEDGTITCKLYDTDLSKLTYKVTVKFKNPDVYKDYELKATESKEITITATQATATIKLGESVANNAITVSKEGVTAKSIKTAIAATLTYAKDSTNSDAKTTYDISDELVYKFSSESTGTYSTTLPDVTNLEKVYVKVSYAGTTGIKSVESEAITVTLDKKEVSAAPTISGTTTFTENTTVTITAASGAKIYYTTNGDTPTTTTGDNCFEYTAAFTLSAGATVKAIAVEDGKLQSAVASQEFTKLSATAKTVTVTVKDATVIIGESYAPEIVVNDGTTDLANVKTIYTVYNEQGKEVQLSDAITTAGKYIISADVQDKTEYNVTTYQSGELTVKTASEAVKDAEDAAQKAIEEATTTKKGDTVVIDGNTYTVTDVTKKTVSFKSVGKSTTYVYIASTITINGDTYKVTAVNANAFKNNKKITNVVIQGSITAIAKNQFSGCTALTSVTIPSTVTVVGAAAFSGCTKLSSVTFMGTKVVTIGEEAFKNCKALTSIDIPSSVTAMTSGVFYNCASLKTVNFKGTGLTAIGANTFYGCKALTSIVITKNVKTIGDNAFSGCAALKTVTFKGTAVTSIGKNAFYGCKKLASIALTKNVKTIGASAFRNCSALKTITIKSTVLSKIGTKAFTGTAKKATAKVPAKKLAAYKKLLKSYKTITVKK
jgi:hypothetical protein